MKLKKKLDEEMSADDLRDSIVPWTEEVIEMSEGLEEEVEDDIDIEEDDIENFDIDFDDTEYDANLPVDDDIDDIDPFDAF